MIEDKLNLLRSNTRTTKGQLEDLITKDRSYKLHIASWTLALIFILLSTIIIMKKK